MSEVTRPGAVNAHTHLYSGLAPLGMPPPPRTPRDFVEILALVWWRLDRALDEGSLRAAARLYVAEALLAGTTTLVDHHESPNLVDGALDILAEEVSALGGRALLTYGATERNGGREEAERGLGECARFIAAGRFARVKGLIGLHASFTVGDDTVRAAGALARELKTPLHVHVAEAAADVDDARSRGHAGPLERLEALGALAPGSVLAHGVWLDEAAVRRADAAGCWLVQNPRSNANNRVGWPRALGASGRVALGTDGFASDMEAEARALAEEAARHADAAPLQPRLDGGRRLAAEHFADLAGDVVIGVPGQPPRRVLVAGEVVVEDGRLVRGDLDAIRAHARQEAARLWARMAAL